MSPILTTFFHNAKSTIRNWKTTAIMFILPVVFMGIFGLVFGSNSNQVDFSIGIYSEIKQPDVSEILRTADKQSDTLSINKKSYSSSMDVKNAVLNKEVDLGVVISQNVQTKAPLFKVIVPTGNPSAIIYESIVKDILMQTVFQGSSPILTENAKTESTAQTGFDVLAPGLIVYGLLILLPGITKRFTEITEQNYLFRYAVSRISSVELILGNVLFYIALGLVQTVLLFGTAKLFGYHASGNVFLALVPAFFTLFFVIALGLLIGSVFKKTDSAMNMGSIVSIILGFFSGSFIAGIGKVLEFQAFGKTMQYNDIFPTRWGTQALDVILTQNKGLADIQNELWILIISGLVTLLLSMWIYSQRQLKSMD